MKTRDRILGTVLLEGWDPEPVEEALLDFYAGIRTCPHCGERDRHPFRHFFREIFVRGGYCTCRGCGERFADPKIGADPTTI